MLYPFEQLEQNANQIDQQLLVCIVKELKAIREALEAKHDDLPIDTEKAVKIENKAPQAVKDKKVCKQCGKSFDNMGLLLAHSRKEHKKEEIKNAKNRNSTKL